jgi:hypothetical protein
MHKIQYLIVIGVVAISASLASCTKQGIATYSGTESVYFTKSYSTGANTTLVTFAYSPSTVTDSLFAIPISVLGNVSQTDRACKITVVDSSSTAIAGVQYDALQDTFKIHAGKVVDTFRIKLHRTPDLQTAGVTLTLMLQPNENFNTDMNSQIINAQTGASFSYVTYTISLVDILTQPKYWLTTYMGNFSRKKVYLTAAVTGVPIATMLDILQNDTGSASVGDQNFWGRTMQLYLNQQNAAGTPVYEDDGVTLMLMGDSVQ